MCKPKSAKPFLAASEFTKAPGTLGSLSLPLAGSQPGPNVPALSKGLARSNSNHKKYPLQKNYYILYLFIDSALPEVKENRLLYRGGRNASNTNKTGWGNKETSWN